MQKLIKNGQLANNDWTVIEQGGELPLNGKVFVNLADWQDNEESLLARDAGIWLNSDQSPRDISIDVNKIPAIAINFPVFADGRGYSYAYILRNELGFSGELRAIGDVLRDQLFYMHRCGFNAYQIRDDRDAANAIEALKDFSHTYQASSDDDKPMFKKRWS